MIHWWLNIIIFFLKSAPYFSLTFGSNENYFVKTREALHIREAFWSILFPCAHSLLLINVQFVLHLGYTLRAMLYKIFIMINKLRFVIFHNNNEITIMFILVWYYGQMNQQFSQVRIRILCDHAKKILRSNSKLHGTISRTMGSYSTYMIHNVITLDSSKSLQYLSNGPLLMWLLLRTLRICHHSLMTPNYCDYTWQLKESAIPLSWLTIVITLDNSKDLQYPSHDP